MKVTSTGGPKGPDGSKRTGKTASSGGSFADSLREASASGEAQPAELSEVSGVAGVDGILAAQGVGDATDERRQRQKLMAFGGDLLDRLDELRLGILTGHFSKEKLTDLAQRLRQKREQSNDPVLNELLAEIELRAEVEIAKYTRK